VAAPSREHRLLLACGRWLLAPDPSASADAGVLEGVDAGRLAELAEGHGMLPLVSRYLGSLGAAGEPLRRGLRAGVLEGSHTALALTAELVAVVRRLEELGIRVAAYKGPALAIQAFGDLSLRRFSDLDLVVEPASLDRAAAALGALGFAGERYESAAQRDVVRRDGHHLVLMRGPVAVELHWRFSKRVFGFGEELTGVWERRETLSVGGTAVPVLAPEDHMLALAIHASKGVWQALEWTLAIAMLARSLPAEAWDGVAARAEAWGCARALQVSLLLSEVLFATPSPAGAWARLPPDAAMRSLACGIAARTLAGTRSPASYLRTQVALRGGGFRKLAFLLRSLFVPSPSDWAGARGTRGGLVLARMARPFRLFRKYGWGRPV
jgi:hypothetical protein